MVASRFDVSPDGDGAAGGGRASFQAATGSHVAGSQQAAAAPALALDRVIGQVHHDTPLLMPMIPWPDQPLALGKGLAIARLQ